MKLKFPNPFSHRGKEGEPAITSSTYELPKADTIQDPMDSVKAIWAKSSLPVEGVEDEIRKQFPEMDIEGVKLVAADIMEIRKTIAEQKVAEK